MSQELLQQLKKAGVVKHGNFILKSGTTSNVYCNFKNLLGQPKLLELLCIELGTLVDDLDDIVFAGVPMGAIPLSIGMSMSYELPSIMIRDQRKAYGMKEIIEGNYNGNPVVIVEDVITSGGSVLQVIDLLEKENIKIQEVIAVLDREQGGVKNIEERGYKISTLFKLSDFS